MESGTSRDTYIIISLEPKGCLGSSCDRLELKLLICLITR